MPSLLLISVVPLLEVMINHICYCYGNSDYDLTQFSGSPMMCDAHGGSGGSAYTSDAALSHLTACMAYEMVV